MDTNVTLCFSEGQQGIYNLGKLSQVSDYFQAWCNFTADASRDVLLLHVQKSEFDCLLEIYQTGECTFPTDVSPLYHLEKLSELADYLCMDQQTREYFENGVGLQRAHLQQISPMAHAITRLESEQRRSNSTLGIYELEYAHDYKDSNMHAVENESRLLAEEVPPSYGQFSAAHDTIGRLRPKEREILSLGGIVIAGGRAVKIVSDLPQSALDQDRSDVDLFLHGMDLETANAHVQLIYAVLADVHVKVYVTSSAVTIKRGSVTWQIVLRLYESTAQILHGFDISACKCLINEEGKAWGTASFFHAYVNKTLIVDPARNSTSYAVRVIKYCLKKGFSIVVPGLEKPHVSSLVYTEPLHTLTNLASLLRIEHEYKVRLQDRRSDWCKAKVLSAVLWKSRFDRTDYGQRTPPYSDFFMNVHLEWRITDPGAQTLNGSFRSLSGSNFYNA
jgi:hypothetical protein